MEPVTFEDLGIQKDILKAVQEMGFVNPSEIQEKAIPLLLNSEKDFIGQAQTGTGKTAAFGIPMLSKIDLSSKNIQALILCPTRELASQVERELIKLAAHMPVRTLSVYGGVSYDKQLRALKKDHPHIIVGTPGRIIDLIQKKYLKFEKTKYCILDEADEMLNMGFYEDVQSILDLFEKERQLIMFSATMPSRILNLVERSFRDYDLVKIKKKTLSNENIEQKYFLVKPRFFKESLTRLIDASPDMYGIVFCKTKIETKTVGEELRKRGHRIEILNGDMKQGERDFAMRNFKDKKATLLVCTDVAARGIDVNNLTHVINYGLPQDNESYVHRIGRTGRAGQLGEAYTITAPNDLFIIKKIENLTKTKMIKGTLPSVTDLKQKAIKKELETALGIYKAIQDKGDKFEVDTTFELFESEFGNLSKEELLKFMFTWKFNTTLRHYSNLSEIEATPGQDRGERGSSRSRSRRTSNGRRDRSTSRNGSSSQRPRRDGSRSRRDDSGDSSAREGSRPRRSRRP